MVTMVIRPSYCRWSNVKAFLLSPEAARAYTLLPMSSTLQMWQYTMQIKRIWNQSSEPALEAQFRELSCPVRRKTTSSPKTTMEFSLAATHFTYLYVTRPSSHLFHLICHLNIIISSNNHMTAISPNFCTRLLLFKSVSRFTEKRANNVTRWLVQNGFPPYVVNAKSYNKGDLYVEHGRKGLHIWI